MQNWEYMVLQLVMNDKENLVWLDAPEDGRSIADRLNDLGTQGWELVSADTNSLSGVTIRTIYYLKRPVE